MKDKILSKIAQVKKYFKDQISDLRDIQEQMFDRHPFIAGHIQGCILVYWTLIIVGYIARIFFKRQLGWVKMK